MNIRKKPGRKLQNILDNLEQGDCVGEYESTSVSCTRKCGIKKSCKAFTAICDLECNILEKISAEEGNDGDKMLLLFDILNENFNAVNKKNGKTGDLFSYTWNGIKLDLIIPKEEPKVVLFKVGGKFEMKQNFQEDVDLFKIMHTVFGKLHDHYE